MNTATNLPAEPPIQLRAARVSGPLAQGARVYTATYVARGNETIFEVLRREASEAWLEEVFWNMPAHAYWDALTKYRKT